ncbi:MAG: cysteine hydrolase [Firmicutes bacterium HGW-Firmicutes-19]|jgi:nicotinamidase-related amidase|nr:MAG: cysteine hydrolase [Firmicutes bacterium HGW-Firmicutes-19]
MKGDNMSKSALIIIDMQVGILADIDYPIFQSQKLIDNINHLIEKARRKDALIIFIRHTEATGSPLEIHQPGWQITPDLHQQSNDLFIEKYTPDSFYKTSLRDILDQQDVKRLIITGVQSEYCVDTTCRSAFALGYETILIEDGHSTCDSNFLFADQIIKHHNQVLGTWFVTLRTHDTMDFDHNL